MDERARIHQSLLRSPLFVGVPRELLGLEIVGILFAVLAFGVSKASVGTAVVVIVPVHLLVRWLCSRDPDGFRVLIEALGYRDHYPAVGTLLPYRAVRSRRSVRR